MLLRSACRMMAAVVLLFFAGHSLAEDKTFDDLKTFDPETQLYLGEMYYSGTGVAVDQAEALRWYTLAAEQGMEAAQFRVGDMHLKGEGTDVDKKTKN